ncbi:AbiV family abortive infection protein [Aquimarina sp. MAR_2010_214]|uniref:AbiV family abortive infection protein n=1 Tax=Aquimarina sp. MAR_2010_214 TaxID=1250026 RepID=UPI000C702C8B|nr:AbiV family abortive infection protein [Aquimarina sp. MAR_2010_214]PKV51891.1 AbiV family abortive infection protein [Aquimarina sp. MAR_2010_214]
MKQFIHLTPKESRGLDIPIYKNALQLKKDAILIANTRKSYSSATSLLILSSEEAIKSVLVRLHAEQYNIYKLKESSKFFRDHKIRHQMAQLIEMGSGLIESMMKYDEQKPTEFLKTKVSWLDDLVNGAIDLVKAASPLLDATERIKELQEFNDLKNKGFYVDYRDGLILPQNEITETIYNRTLFITERVVRFSKLIRILSHEKLENHMPNEEINKNKELLKDFIDNAMQDFSFKDLNKSMA